MIIYKTTNNINGKIYIGQDSKNNPKYLGSGHLIYRAIKKYGISNFTKEILEICDCKEELNNKEIYWIEKLDSTNYTIGYNISKGGTGGKLVDVEAKKGKTYEEYYGPSKAIEIKNKLSIMRNLRKFELKNISREEVNKKISEGNKGKIRTDDNKTKISETLKDFYKSEQGFQNKEKLKKLKTGVKLSGEHKLKISNSMIGKKPKTLEVHPSARYWFFYDKENNLVLETLGDRTKRLKELKTNQKRIVIFDNKEDCLSHKLEDNKDYKVYWKKYYK
jgi:hypothetical protein